MKNQLASGFGSLLKIRPKVKAQSIMKKEPAFMHSPKAGR